MSVIFQSSERHCDSDGMILWLSDKVSQWPNPLLVLIK